MGQAYSRRLSGLDNREDLSGTYHAVESLMSESHDHEHQRSQKLKKRHRHTFYDDGDSSKDEPAAKRIRMLSRTTPNQSSLLLHMENEQLQAKLERRDAQITKLKRQSDRTTRKLVKGRIGDLEWCLLYKPDGQPQVLGNGTYGMVYKAFCASKEKYLAAKVVLDLTPKSAEILQKELKQLMALEPHDRIVTYFGTCYAKHPRFGEKCLFVFTEFMPGGSLSSYLDKNGPLTKTLMWHYTGQILEGVEYLHECKIIHRDIKGSNIMRDLKDNVKLADFGSAKQICSESLNNDTTRYPYGTLPWTAPEVLRGEKAQPESDIWSVGATIVEMLTGEMPYITENFDNRLAIIYQVGNNKINPLTSMKNSARGYELDSTVEYILMFCFKCLAKERPSAASLNKLIYYNNIM